MPTGEPIDTGLANTIFQALSALGVMFLLAVKFGFFGGRRDAAVDGAVSKAALLEALETTRHDMRGEINTAVGKCVSSELFLAELRSLDKRIEFVEKQVRSVRGRGITEG